MLRRRPGRDRSPLLRMKRQTAREGWFLTQARVFATMVCHVSSPASPQPTFRPFPERRYSVAHMIDETTGQAAVFVVGEPAWHGLGKVLQAAVTASEAIKLAGLDWTVE